MERTFSTASRSRGRPPSLSCRMYPSVLHVSFFGSGFRLKFSEAPARDHTAHSGRFNSAKNSAPVGHGSSMGFEAVLCSRRNKTLHTLNGNTSSPTVLSLDALVPYRVYTRSHLLSCCPSKVPHDPTAQPKAAVLSLSSALDIEDAPSPLPTLVPRTSTTPPGFTRNSRPVVSQRSGCRVRFKNSDGTFTCYRRAKGKRNRRIHRINRMFIQTLGPSNSEHT